MNPLRKIHLSLRLMTGTLLLVVAACGKNVPYGYGYAGGPLAQAPGYPGGYGAPYGMGPFGGYPGAPNFGLPASPPPPPPGPGGPLGAGSPFSPLLPSGFPAAYTPFLPMDYFMRSNPALAPGWQALWTSWSAYAVQSGTSMYDFSTFWLRFLPLQWNTPAYMSLYQYFNQMFYYWMTPNMVFAPTMAPQTFWVNYQGFAF